MKRDKNILSKETAIEYIKTYFDKTTNDPHGRYLSWMHCYNTFMQNRGKIDNQIIDYLCLHLAFFLASWGMYRGSSFLLQKDYMVHAPVVEIIMEETYNPLAAIESSDLIKPENLDLLDEISNRIRKAYADEQPAVDRVLNNATSTLVTKILLGTLGCVPAYDRYLIQAVRQYGISSGTYSRNSVESIAKYYISNEKEFEKLRKQINTSGTSYPHMKLMDMCLWQAGVVIDKK